MNNIDLVGVDPSFSPLSNSFSINLINEKLFFKKDIRTINRISVSIQNEFVNSYLSLGKNYNCIYISINIKFDYVCNDNSINYELVSLNKLINVCSKEFKYDRRCNIYSNTIDANVLNINNNEVDFYVIFGCSLC